MVYLISSKEGILEMFSFSSSVVGSLVNSKSSSMSFGLEEENIFLK